MTLDAGEHLVNILAENLAFPAFVHLLCILHFCQSASSKAALPSPFEGRTHIHIAPCLHFRPRFV